MTNRSGAPLPKWRRAVALSLAAALAGPVVGTPATALAATWSQLNDESTYLVEDQSGSCVITSTMMMIRRAALLNGDPNWESYTNATLRAAGLAHMPFSFSLAGVTVGHKNVSGLTVAQLEELVDEHPEGVVIYCSYGNPHAVLLVDYDAEDNIYVVDPWYGERMLIEECITVRPGNINAYWYVTSEVADPLDVPDRGHEPGWAKIGGDWFCYDEDGVLYTGWAIIDGSEYYLGKDGAMRTGWQQIEDDWYYFGHDGAMRTGWQKYGAHWYYFYEVDGTMATGPAEIDGAQYRFSESGAMLTGWVLDDYGFWHYLRADGRAVVDSWWSINHTWYHFEEEGSMTTGLYEDSDGSTYYFDSTGAMAKGWKQLGFTWRYFSSTGVMFRNAWQDGYYLKDDGTMAVNEWANGQHFDANGLVDIGSNRAN